MMRRMMTMSAVLLAAVVSGCANPADDVPQATVGAPVQESTSVAPTPEPTPASTSAVSAPEPTPTASAATGSSLVLTPETSKIEFIGSKVTGSHNGGFKAFTGTVDLTEDGKGVRAMAADIDMNSTWSDNEKLTGHLKSPDFFDVAKFPKATFVSTEIAPGGEKDATHTVTGNFTLHGVTKSIKFPVKVAVSDGSAKVDSEFFINRKDFGIVYPGQANNLIRDEVVIKLALNGTKPSGQ
jgi:polyisoprenoid-binding protein YceI